MFFSVYVREMNSFYNNCRYDIIRIINTPSYTKNSLSNIKIQNALSMSCTVATMLFVQ